MPTIAELPTASQAGAQDELPISQDGITRSVSVAELLSSTQQAIEVSSPSVLGRASLGPGGPEALTVGAGLAVQNAAIAANGGDHALFVEETNFGPNDQAIINANGTPMRLPLTALRALFSAGNNVSITTNGIIASTTDPSVSSSLTALGQGVSSAAAGIAQINAKLPANGFASLNAAGQVTSPIAGDVSLGTVVSGNAALARSLAAKALDFVNILDFGAQRGGADCTAAFNAAFAQLSGDGGTLLVPAGEYWLASPLVFSGKALAICGAGKGQTKIHIGHTGIGFDLSPGTVFNRIILRDFSIFAENASGQTAAAARITFPYVSSFGYVTLSISDVECFGYPNSANGTTPFPQTFLRGFVLNNCWSAQLDNISWFGPPSAAGATSCAVIELNTSFDTRIHGIQCYYGNTVVLQTGYCEGIYITNPVVVGTDYLFSQTNETGWSGYVPDKAMLLGIWVSNGEVNTNLGTVSATNVTDGFFTNLDITRDGGPAGPQVLFNLNNVTNFNVSGCHFVGGGSKNDVAFGFSSSWNSSGNIITGCYFEDMATVIQIAGSNGTVEMTTSALNIGNVPIATAFIDATPNENGNYLSFMTPAQTGVPAGIGNTHDHVMAGRTGNVLFRVSNIANSANFIRHQPAIASGTPILCFDGADSTVNGSIQTKGGSLAFTAAGASGNSGFMLNLLNVNNASGWIVLQNATTGNLSQISTNAGGLALEPKGELLLAPTGGLFAYGLPTSKPTAGSSQIWNNGGVLSVA